MTDERDATDEQDELFVCPNCRKPSDEAMLHPRLGVCIECVEVAYDDYLRYGRDDD
jgi:transcription initiation factor IIE alpha subunit